MMVTMSWFHAVTYHYSSKDRDVYIH